MSTISRKSREAVTSTDFAARKLIGFTRSFSGMRVVEIYMGLDRCSML